MSRPDDCRAHKRPPLAAPRHQPSSGRSVSAPGGARSCALGWALLACLTAPALAGHVPIDRGDRAQARGAGDTGSALLASGVAREASEDRGPGLPGADDRLREQMRTAGDDPVSAAPEEAPLVPSPAIPADRVEEPGSLDLGLPLENLAAIGLLGILGAAGTWWMARRRPRRRASLAAHQPTARKKAKLTSVATQREPGLIGRTDGSTFAAASSQRVLATTLSEPVSAGRAPRFPSAVPVSLRGPATGPRAEAPARVPVPAVSAPATAGDDRAAKAPDRMDRLERSLLAVADVVQNLVESLPTAPLSRARDATRVGGDPIDPNLVPEWLSDPAPASFEPPGRAAPVLSSSEPAERSAGALIDAPLDSLPEAADDSLESAWERFLEVEGEARSPIRPGRRRRQVASRIARARRAQAASVVSSGKEEGASGVSSKVTPESVPPLVEPPASGGVSRLAMEGPPASARPVPEPAQDPISELTRVREQVLELAGRGVSSEEICRNTDLSPGEVGLILKSLFSSRS